MAVALTGERRALRGDRVKGVQPGSDLSCIASGEKKGLNVGWWDQLMRKRPPVGGLFRIAINLAEVDLFLLAYFVG